MPMTNGKKKVEMVLSRIKLVFKYLWNNSQVRLSVINILVLCWAIDYRSKEHNEAMLPELEEAGYFTWASLTEIIYNMMIMTLFINIIVVAKQIITKKNRVQTYWDQIVKNLYFFITCLCMSIGCIYLGYSNTYRFEKYCILFKLPIMIFGEDAIVNTLTAEKVYATLCIIFLLTILVDTCTSFVRRTYNTTLSKNVETNNTHE